MIKGNIKFYLLSALFLIPTFNKAHEYKSQFGQDKFVHENFFLNKRNGVFIDIGAHDGVLLSNTYFFEKELGWKGICIEPQPNIFEQLEQNRSCLKLNMCIGKNMGLEKFIWVQDYANMLSGLESTFDPRHLERVKLEIQLFGGKYEVIDVPTMPLNKLLHDNNIYHVDYLTIDTEGSELEILKSIDFETYYFHVIDVENNYQSREIRTFLESKGFNYITNMDVDEIYCNSIIRE